MKDITKTAATFKNNGFDILPTFQKAPCLHKRTSWKDEIPTEEFTRQDSRGNMPDGIGMKAGKVNGNLECIDFDNHFEDATENFVKWTELIKDLWQEHEFYVEETMSGGYHVVYQCEIPIEGNLKLAMRNNEELNKIEALIETRGEGGYWCCAPTKGYKCTQGKMSALPIISWEERDELMSAARSMNEYVKPSKLKVRQPVIVNFSDSKLEDFNNSDAGINAAKDALHNEGWQEMDDIYWRRPGKEKGCHSASFGHISPSTFWVFSSGGAPFEMEKPYTPFMVLAELEYAGDHTAAYKGIFQKEQAENVAPTMGEGLAVKAKIQPIPPQNKKEVELDPEDLFESFREFIIDDQSDITPPVSVVEIFNGNRYSTPQRCLTLGNYSLITGDQGSKKTALSTILTAAALGEGGEKFKPCKIEGKEMVLYIDTEQADSDTDVVRRRIEYIAGSNKNLVVVCLRELNYSDRCAVIGRMFKYYNHSIKMVVIDGIADLVTANNDELDSVRVIQLLMTWSSEYNCHIIGVMHLNRSAMAKATGQLGAYAERKNAVEFKVSKSLTEGNWWVSDVKCGKMRYAGYWDSFEINISSGMPVADKFGAHHEGVDPVERM